MEPMAEGSESSNSNTNRKPISKRQKPDYNGCSARFKGIVPQQNGHWGAQIYTNHQRVWLGTSNSEKEAAMAYDSASINLRSGDSYRNFPWSNLTVQEPRFQSHYSRETVLNMIKNGSYQSNFLEFLNNQSEKIEKGVNENTMNLLWNGKFLSRQLFQKELTPSDVGKHNKLVIPKKYAVKFFPRIRETDRENGNAGMLEDVLLLFYDKFMRLWKFRYCYWKSSQSFVFTRGWNRFVKEKNLEANDTVTFYKSQCTELVKEGQSICLIDVIYKSGEGEINNGTNKANDKHIEIVNEILLKDSREIVDQGLDEDEMGCMEEKTLKTLESKHVAKRKFARLFGVQISSE